MRAQGDQPRPFQHRNTGGSGLFLLKADGPDRMPISVSPPPALLALRMSGPGAVPGCGGAVPARDSPSGASEYFGLLLSADSRFFALLGSAPQELNTVRPEAELTC
jgi:hypothetical protein